MGIGVGDPNPDLFALFCSGEGIGGGIGTDVAPGSAIH